MGFGVWGLGFGVWGLGFGVSGVWFLVSGFWAGSPPWMDCDDHPARALGNDVYYTKATNLTTQMLLTSDIKAFV